MKAIKTDYEKIQFIRDINSKDVINRLHKKVAKTYLEELYTYELGNHEYCVTYDLSDALEALGTTEEEIKQDSRLERLLKDAIKEYMKDF